MRSKTALAVIALLVLVPQVALAGPSRSFGAVPGDRIVYGYHAHNSYINDTTDANVTTDLYWNLTIAVESVNMSSSLPFIQYNILVQALDNGAVVQSTSERNQTTIFDPFDGGTYLGNLGFPAFIFTDVPNQTKTFGFSYPTSNSPPWAGANETQQPSNVTVSVERTQNQIKVYLTDTIVGFSVPFMKAAMVFDGSTGIMQHLYIYTALADNYKNFFYDLESYSKPFVIPWAYIWYAVAAAVVAIVVVSLIRRPNRRQRKVDRLRKRMREG